MRPEETTLGLGVYQWIGESGQKYRYSVHMYGTVFGPGPANFVFARELRPGKYLPLYFGETADLSEPFGDLSVVACIKEQRVTHVHVRHGSDREEVRRAERSDLIAQWKPACNTMR